MIDNYDSFVYNLVRYFKELDQETLVVRNDAISIAEIKILQPEAIIISPGPKAPKDVNLVDEIIRCFAGVIPILGICLGHQAIAHAFGANIVQGASPMHGKISTVFHDGKGLFHNLINGFKVTRYHSLVIEKESLPDCFEITCVTEDQVIMGIRHKFSLLEGVQFHPEAELSEYGHEILENFIRLCKKGDLSHEPTIHQ